MIMRAIILTVKTVGFRARIIYKTYGLYEVKFSEWMKALRQEILKETLVKIEEQENTVRKCV